MWLGALGSSQTGSNLVVIILKVESNVGLNVATKRDQKLVHHQKPAPSFGLAILVGVVPKAFEQARDDFPVRLVKIRC